MPATRKQMLVLYAGGTIGMVPGQSGFTPGHALPDWLTTHISQHPDLNAHQWHIHTQPPLLDSANAQPQDWYAIARTLWQWQPRIDGVVVLHGTDTLAYAAALLSFLMRGFGRPIVLTASQRPLGVADSDAPANLLGALQTALLDELAEVAVCFGGTLWRGNRILKQSDHPVSGFVSPHWPALGQHTDKGWAVHHQALLPTAPLSDAPMVTLDSVARVGLLRLYPGIPAEVVSALGQAHPDGLILETYGLGTGPGADPGFCRALADLVAAGTPVVAVSQCPWVDVDDLGVYEAGHILADLGVIAGRDLTPSAAFAKLHALHARLRTQPADQHAALIHQPLAGEIRACQQLGAVSNALHP